MFLRFAALGGHPGAQPRRPRGAMPRRAQPLDDTARDHRRRRWLDRSRRRAAAPCRARPTQWLRHPEARGFSAAVNRGLASATGDPLLLLNSDAEVTEGGDHALRAAFDRGLRRCRRDRRPPGRGAVAARLVYPDGRPQWSGGAFPSLLWLFALASGLGRGARASGPPPPERRRPPASAAALSTGPRAPRWRCRAPAWERHRAVRRELPPLCPGSRLLPAPGDCRRQRARPRRLGRRAPPRRRLARPGERAPATGQQPRPALARPAALGAPASRRRRGRAGRARAPRGGRLRLLRLARRAAAARRSPSRPPSGPSQATAAAQGSAKPPTKTAAG